jgi:predicted GIY-YIG superfamily endonuclease
MTDFRDADDPRPHFVYRCFDAAGQLLYVGCALDVEDRMFHHTHTCNIGKVPNGQLQRHMTSWTAEEHPDKATARAAERRTIAAEAPLLNRQHNPRRFARAADGYVPVEPVHPLTAEAHRMATAPPPSMDQLREAMKSLSELFKPLLSASP